ncbi:TIGR02302 family protein [bacterium]|nr:TIGR02302 family protein [bacterium]
MNESKPEAALKRIEMPLRLTLLGLWAERLSRAFWPLWTALIAGLGLAALGVQDHLPLEVDWFGLVSLAFSSVWALVHGWVVFRRPTRDEALARLDSRLPGRPIAALRDSLAMGSEDAATQAIWAVHRDRMALRASAAKAVEPDLKLASRDPYALRYMALTVLVLALLFGSIWRVASVATLPAPVGPGQAAAGPAWEGWAQPPAYTGKPALYLSDQKGETLLLPAGTRIQLRFYGAPGALILAETVSGRTDVPPASNPTQDFTVRQSGVLKIEGAGGREWLVTLLPDAPPAIKPTGQMDRDADGRFKQPFEATDDYGVVKGSVSIALDLAAVDRRYGLTPDPEPRDPVVLDLPMPMKRDRTKVDQVLVDDLSKDVMSNLPVTLTFTATDAAGQTATSQPLHVVLPGRRFFDPIANAIIEMRRDLLWNRSNAPRVDEILKAITYKPEGFFPNTKAYLRLRTVISQLDSASAPLDTKARDGMAEELWQIALMVEDGELSSAYEAMKRAQDRLDEAIRNGASPAEIDRLMKEMRDALNNYMSQQAQKNAQNPDEPSKQNSPTMKMTQDQLQQMLDKLQELMKEGRTAEAQALMQQLRDFMNNMKVEQGKGQGQGQGQGSPGQQAMKDLGQTLRDQQKLSDDSFHGLQNGQQGQPDPNAQGGQSQDGQPGDHPNGQSLADRQQALKDRIDRLGKSGTLPGAGDPKGEEGRRKLDQAGRAMKDAENALRDGNLPQALDKQAQALDALRQGIRQLGDALAQSEQDRNPNDGQATADATPRGQRDPLGRDSADSAQIGSNGPLRMDQDVYRRAQELLDEIRKRAGDQARPDQERSYLRRLLDLF